MYRHALLALACLVLIAPALAAAPLWTHNGTEAVRAVALSSNGQVVAVSSDVLHIFDRKGTLLATTWRANDVAVNSAGTLIVSGADDAVRAIVKNGSELWSRPNGAATVTVSGDGGTVAALDPDGDLWTYSAAGAQLGKGDVGAKGLAVKVAASKNGSVVVAVDKGGVQAFTRTKTARWSFDILAPNALAMNASGDLVAIGDGGSVKFFNLTGTRTATFPTGGGVLSLAMNPSANLTVAGVEDGTVAALGPQGDLLWSLPLGSRVNRVAVSESGALVAVASADRTLRLVAGNGTPLWNAALAGEPVSLALSADGTTVAVGCDEGTAYVFDSGVKPAATAAPTKAANATASNTTAAKGTVTINATGARNGTALNGTAGNATGSVSGAATVNGTAKNATGAANGTAAGNRTTGVPAKGTVNATATTPLQLVVPSGTPTSDIPPCVPAGALALLAAWIAYRRSR
jgi:WD40 repeat protein